MAPSMLKRADLGKRAKSIVSKRRQLGWKPELLPTVAAAGFQAHWMHVLCLLGDRRAVSYRRLICDEFLDLPTAASVERRCDLDSRRSGDPFPQPSMTEKKSIGARRRGLRLGRASG